MAILGSGPAGFYTAYKVMSSIQDSIVDMYEYLPVPFGLVRFGVAPDHPEVKNCQDKFTEVASSPRFNFIGNVEIGKGLRLASLKDHYNAILFAYGASKDRKLGIVGENLNGIYSARDFVGWYNGLPEHADLAPNLESGEEAVIIGQGNVALDVARTLLSDVDTLMKTDMTHYALATLSKSRVKRVRVVGRRGLMQASFTIKELRELMNLPRVAFDHIPPELFPNATSDLPRKSKRLVQLLSKGSPSLQCESKKSWSLDFLLSPTAFKSTIQLPSNLSSMTFVKNELQGPDVHDASAKVLPTSQTVSMPTNLAFRSIGYQSEALDGMKDLGIHFDESRGIIPNDYYGRVTTSSLYQGDLNVIPGMYCSGWVKRGPAGVIANTMEDAFATAEAIAGDWETQKPFLTGGQGWDTLEEEARKRGLRSVSWRDWEKIDAAEKERGKAIGKEREKFASISKMLSVLS